MYVLLTAYMQIRSKTYPGTSTLWSILFETILDHVFLHVPKEYKANFLGLNIGPSMGYFNPSMIFEWSDHNLLFGCFPDETWDPKNTCAPLSKWEFSDLLEMIGITFQLVKFNELKCIWLFPTQKYLVWIIKSWFGELWLSQGLKIGTSNTILQRL